MLRAVSTTEPVKGEGYVYVVYGSEKYLRHAVASVTTLRRYDTTRPVALLCESHHRDILERNGLTDVFDYYIPLQPEHCSIVGFKHHVHNYMVFDKNLYLDSDMVWCKNPDPLWDSLKPYPFTITGTLVSDPFFGARKDAGILKDILLNKRKRTLKNFGLTYLSRVQSGMIYASSYDTAKMVCTSATEMLSRKNETHFRSRTLEEGRNEESCEWSLAMAMAKLDVPVYPWLQGNTSPQLDFIEDLTDYDPEFEYVTCRFYSNPFVYSLRGIKSARLRSLFIKLLSLYPGNGDYMMVTPFCLHFGWYHQKQPFNRFADMNWQKMIVKSVKNQADVSFHRDSDVSMPAF